MSAVARLASRLRFSKSDVNSTSAADIFKKANNKQAFIEISPCEILKISSLSNLFRLYGRLFAAIWPLNFKGKGHEQS